jgi:phage terminase large subunit-like protein
VTDYAEQVVGGRIVTGTPVRLACERHLRDLQNPNLRFDEEKADLAIDFFQALTHSKGEWAGTPVLLEPWQKFIIGSIFGWFRQDGTRRFRKTYTEVARKNGKSLIAAGVGLLLAFFDNEPGAEVYAAATKRDQAKIVWGEARRMVRASDGLKKRITTLVANLHSEATNSKFEPLGADEDSMDGLNIHGVIIDELHAHKNRKTYDVLNTATGARRQPMMFIITTAGYDRESICWQEHDYGIKILEQTINDESFFAYIATIEPDDDWGDPAVWIKANPNLGVSVKEDKIAEAVNKAKQVPGEQNALLRLHMDVWTQQADRWIDMATYDACDHPIDPDDLRGRPCYAGLDLSTVKDISALELWFPPEEEGEPVKILSMYWVPEDNIHKRSRDDRVPYDVWVREGYIKATEGNVVDYDVIRLDIGELGLLYEIKEIAVDRWNSTQLQTQLAGDGFEVADFGQGFASMTAPVKEIERRILERGISFGQNPVLKWMFSNIAVEQDAAGNLKMSKKLSREKIDGPVALAMACGRAIVQEDEVEVGVYFA